MGWLNGTVREELCVQNVFKARQSLNEVEKPTAQSITTLEFGADCEWVLKVTSKLASMYTFRATSVAKDWVETATGSYPATDTGSVTRSEDFSLPSGWRALSDLVRLEPHGVSFPEPVEIAIPIHSCHMFGTGNPPEFWRSLGAESGPWEKVPGVLGEDGLFHVKLSHFCMALVCQQGSRNGGCRAAHQLHLTCLVSKHPIPLSNEHGQEDLLMELAVLIQPLQPPCRRCAEHAQQTLQQLTGGDQPRFTTCGESRLDVFGGQELDFTVDGIQMPRPFLFSCEAGSQVINFPRCLAYSRKTVEIAKIQPNTGRRHYGVVLYFNPPNLPTGHPAGNPHGNQGPQGYLFSGEQDKRDVHGPRTVPPRKYQEESIQGRAQITPPQGVWLRQGQTTMDTRMNPSNVQDNAMAWRGPPHTGGYPRDPYLVGHENQNQPSPGDHQNPQYGDNYQRRAPVSADYQNRFNQPQHQNHQYQSAQQNQYHSYDNQIPQPYENQRTWHSSGQPWNSLNRTGYPPDQHGYSSERPGYSTERSGYSSERPGYSNRPAHSPEPSNQSWNHSSDPPNQSWNQGVSNRKKMPQQGMSQHGFSQWNSSHQSQGQPQKSWFHTQEEETNFDEDPPEIPEEGAAKSVKSSLVKEGHQQPLPLATMLLRDLANNDSLMESFVTSFSIDKQGERVIFLRFKKLSPRGLEEEAAHCCGLVLKDFVGCIVRNPSQLQAMLQWVCGRLWDNIQAGRRCLGAKFQVLEPVEATKILGVDTVDNMKGAALALSTDLSMGDSIQKQHGMTQHNARQHLGKTPQIAFPVIKGSVIQGTALNTISRKKQHRQQKAQDLLPTKFNSNFNVSIKNTFVADYEQQEPELVIEDLSSARSWP